MPSILLAKSISDVELVVALFSVTVASFGRLATSFFTSSWYCAGQIVWAFPAVADKMKNRIGNIIFFICWNQRYKKYLKSVKMLKMSSNKKV
jgi:hypothetical protein